MFEKPGGNQLSYTSVFFQDCKGCSSWNIFTFDLGREATLLPKENLVEGSYSEVACLIFKNLMIISLFAVKMCSGKMLLYSTIIQWLF